MGAFKTAWGAWVCPTAGDNVLDRDVVKLYMYVTSVVCVVYF